jgi:hypothetical protein
MEQTQAQAQNQGTQSETNQQTQTSEQQQDNKQSPKAEDQDLKAFIDKEGSKLDREMELREKIKALERERDEVMSKSAPKQSSPEVSDREMLLDVREYSLENSKKYPLIFATNASSLIVDEMRKQAKKTGRAPDMDLIFDTIESKIEDYELKKAERLKGTPLYEKLYGNGGSAPKVEEPKASEASKPKKRAIPKDDGRPKKDNSVPMEAPSKVISADEAHQLAYEAYLSHRRNDIVKK